MIHFFKHRAVVFFISICIICISIIVLFINGIYLDIQFKGGTILKYTYAGTIDVKQAENAIVQSVGVTANGQLQSSMGKQLLILRFATNQVLTLQEQETITTALVNAFPDAQLKVSEVLTVEPLIAKDLFINGIIAIILSFLIIPVYTGLRFKSINGLSAGTVAFITLIHDALIVAMVFIVFKIPLNEMFMVAILATMGLSITDTMVVYDRIRENQTLFGGKVSVDELADLSITQSLSRIVNINVAVFLSITVIYIFSQIYNIEPIRSFALSMMFGTISGCYSTIFIAGPLWIICQS